MWKLPSLVQRFKDAKYVAPQPAPALGDGLGDSPRPDQPDERVIWSQFTAADARREARTRAEHYQSQKREFQAAKRSSEPASASQKALKKRRSAAKAQAPAEDSDGSDNSCDQAGMAVGSMDSIHIGDLVMLSPDTASRAVVEKSGYKLGLNIGRVQDLDLNNNMAKLWWYYSSCVAWTPKTVFVPWRDSKTHEPYMDWIDIDVLVQDSEGILVKVELCKQSGREGFAKHILSKSSYKVVQSLL